MKKLLILSIFTVTVVSVSESQAVEKNKQSLSERAKELAPNAEKEKILNNIISGTNLFHTRVKYDLQNVTQAFQTFKKLPKDYFTHEQIKKITDSIETSYLKGIELEVSLTKGELESKTAKFIDKNWKWLILASALGVFTGGLSVAAIVTLESAVAIFLGGMGAIASVITIAISGSGAILGALGLDTSKDMLKVTQQILETLDEFYNEIQNTELIATKKEAKPNSY
ncbi:MAG TPA: hypothetical protein VHA52_05150 [Candidatus Babeliaceae bacterium]|nr:hypothetical protein [Candidatus Babeliaceae bacterium]